MTHPHPPPILLAIRGMHCAGCVGVVEGALRGVPGVSTVNVNLATERASVQPAGDVSVEALVAAIKRAGYDAEPAASLPKHPAAHGDGHESHQHGEVAWRRFWIALGAGAPLLVMHLLHAIGMHPPAWWASNWGYVLRAGLALATAAIAGGPMLAGAARALFSARANMDLLVSVGVCTAFGAGITGMLTGRAELIEMLDAGVMIILLVALGKNLEARSRSMASSALRGLYGRIPPTAIRVRGDQIETVPLDEIEPGDTVRIVSHQRVPVDGEIVSGTVAADESLLTGESTPIERGPGQRVLGGSNVVDGLADIRVTARGDESVAARIAQLVEQAQLVKPEWQRLADRVASVFVPVVLTLGALVLLGWWLTGAQPIWAFQRALAVIVVACPCALGLAVPTAILVATTRAAERGLIVRDPRALEAAAKIRRVLLDKTGTLTTGRLALTHHETFGAISPEWALALAAALAQHSQHPLSRALVDAHARTAQGQALPAVHGFASSPGGGLRGVVERDNVLLGNTEWLERNGADAGPFRNRYEDRVSRGESVAWLAVGGRPAALFAFADTVHPESRQAIQELAELGIRTTLLSGDREPVVSEVARAIGVDDFAAQLQPAAKLEIVQSHQAVPATRPLRADSPSRAHRPSPADRPSPAHRHSPTDRRSPADRHSSHRMTAPVAMVGDGVNDGPALAAADVGIAIGSGADVARDVADISIIPHSPRLIAELVRLARRTSRVMRQNLAWAAGYNLLMIPLAAFAPLPASLAAAAMMLSSISVVLNSLRLRSA